MYTWIYSIADDTYRIVNGYGQVRLDSLDKFKSHKVQAESIYLYICVCSLRTKFYVLLESRLNRNYVTENEFLAGKIHSVTIFNNGTSCQVCY